MQNSKKAIKERFLSLTDQEHITALVRDTYLRLIDCARSLQPKPGDDFPLEDDLDAAADRANLIRGSDMTKACQLFSSVRLGISSSSLNTAKLLEEIRNASDSDMTEVYSKMHEFRGCCFAVRALRNWVTHGDVSEVSPVRAAFIASCVTNMFVISDSLHRNLGMDFKHTESKDEYSRRLNELIAASFGERDAKGEESDVEEDGFSLALREISSDIKSLSSAVEVLGDQGGLAATLKAIQDQQASTMLVASEIKQHLVLNQLKPQSSDEANGEPIADGGEDNIRLSVAEAEDRLIQLRNRIFSAMNKDNPNFAGYHNLLQRPLISAALDNQCRSLDSFKDLDEYKRRIVQESRYPREFEKAQFKRFGKDIDNLLGSIDYTNRPSAVSDDTPSPDFDDLDDGIPF